MTYVMSDLHGCYEEYLEMLEKIQFSDQDSLYILGDVVDRGLGSLRVLQDIMKRKNVTVLRGNHDQIAYSLLLKCHKKTLDKDSAEVLKLWINDGGAPTFQAFMELPFDYQEAVLGYLSKMPIMKEINIRNRKYLLAHTVPAKEKMQDYESCTIHDYLLGNPEYDRQYFHDTIVVTGHTPTFLIDEKSEGKIWKGNHHLAIDCGCVFGYSLGCMCLESEEEFYVGGFENSLF